MRRIGILVAATLAWPGSGAALVLDDPANFTHVNTWSGASLGVPGLLGGLDFSADGTLLYVVGDSEQVDSAVYAVQVTRDPATGQVIDLGPASATTLVFDGDPTIPGLDAGLDIGPEGTLFYTYWNANHLGQRPGGYGGPETTWDLGPVGVPVSVAGLDFSPVRTDPTTGYAQLQVSSWQGNNVYELFLSSVGGGLFEPTGLQLLVALPQQGTGAIRYVPSGMFVGNLMYVNWDFGEVRMIEMDRATGLPIDADTGLPTLGTTNPLDLRFAHDLGVGPWGLAFDELTDDFFVATWQGSPSNAILQITGPGFENLAPFAEPLEVETAVDTPVAITLSGFDPEGGPLTFGISSGVTQGTLSGVAPDLTYSPFAGFVGEDSFEYKAHDGIDESDPALVTIAVLAPGDDDDAVDDDDSADDDDTVDDDDSADDDDTVDDEGGDDDDSGPDEVADCACSSTGGSGPVGLALGLVAFSRRRRRLTPPGGTAGRAGRGPRRPAPGSSSGAPPR